MKRLSAARLKTELNVLRDYIHQRNYGLATMVIDDILECREDERRRENVIKC